VARACARLGTPERAFVIGRGFNFATALELSLKLKELGQVPAEPYSAADFRHGPIAVVEQGFPVIAIAPGGAVAADVDALLQHLKIERQAKLVVLSERKAAVAMADIGIKLPHTMPEWLSPVPAIVAGQLLAYFLGKAKGLDVDQPRGLTKVTQTK
jgi:glucosamine--fructose-6-phosphate aminotransferase (isomerizing)